LPVFLLLLVWDMLPVLPFSSVEYCSAVPCTLVLHLAAFRMICRP
jgi:hypothetical protein